MDITNWDVSAVGGGGGGGESAGASRLKVWNVPAR